MNSPKFDKKSLLIYSRSTDGHRGEYNDVIMHEAKIEGIQTELIGTLRISALSQPIFFTMIDEDIFSFLVASASSLLTRIPVTGLLFRPGECFISNSLKYRIKFALFHLISKIPSVNVYTILPFHVDERFSYVAKDWIYDLQFWDLLQDDTTLDSETSPLGQDIARHAKGRTIVTAIGAQNRAKGFNYFSNLWCMSQDIRDRFLFVAAGKIALDSQEEAHAFEQAGGLLYNRHMTRAEILDAYNATDLVWASYSPQYNQASGIASRAFQFGVPVITREKCYMAKALGELSHPAILISHGDVALDGKRLTEGLQTISRKARPKEKMLKMRNYFRLTLRRAAGGGQ